MIAIAGGIILAVFALLVLAGLYLVARDTLRFIGRFVRANLALTAGLIGLLLVGLYVNQVTNASKSVEVSASSPGVTCTGQCVYR